MKSLRWLLYLILITYALSYFPPICLGTFRLFQVAGGNFCWWHKLFAQEFYPL